uniref:Uncharacterized protein n=1 Tax=Glycine max TaxID=3847 RepID=C6TF72_SOYBN|nr:unknown [Glycine max]
MRQIKWNLIITGVTGSFYSSDLGAYVHRHIYICTDLFIYFFGYRHIYADAAICRVFFVFRLLPYGIYISGYGSL